MLRRENHSPTEAPAPDAPGAAADLLLARDRRRIRSAAALVAVFGLAYVGSDLVVADLHGGLVTALAARAVLVSSSLLAVFGLRGRPGEAVYVRIAATWVLSLGAAMIAIRFTRAPTYQPVHIWMVLATFGVYTLVRAPLWAQVSTGSAMLLGELAYWGLVDPARLLTAPGISVVGAILFVNAAGLLANRLMADTRRSLEELYEGQREARASLEKALAEVRTLRGIVPVCMHCHSVRDAAGLWHPLAEWVTANTEADVSHGVCPSCFDEHYADP